MKRMEQMLAIQATRPGAPEVLHLASDLPVPQPRKGTVRVKVQAASVNPIDTHRRRGYGGRLFGLMGAGEFPLVLGNDFAGLVDAVGPGVNRWRPGQRVCGCKGASRLGSHAQFTVVAADQLLEIPGGVDANEAASLPYAFTTAYRLLTDGLKALPRDFGGKAVLVHGGAGAVGSLAVQMLRAWGAGVAISGRHTDKAPASELATAGTLDLSQVDTSVNAGRFDAVLNCASFDDEPRLFPLLHPGSMGYATIVHPLLATLDAHGWVGGALAARRTWRERATRAKSSGAARYRWVLFKPVPEALAELDRLLRKGAIKPRVGAIFSLDQATAAHRSVEQGGRLGKVVLTMPDETQ